MSEEREATLYQVSVLRDRIERLGCARDILLENIKEKEVYIENDMTEINRLDRQIAALDDAIQKLRRKEDRT